MNDFMGWYTMSDKEAKRSAVVYRRRQWVKDCAYCAEHKPSDFFPAHDASNNCESGKRDHCTCDTCF